mmetsp:Transcript_715/g.837  ORF Transcript_715/g.837 Transcript_715/m.837 type:complete len:353 (-) Transcript_715:33-1091(-)|eukprot:CAMPEP_0205825524 /NCGR_PEP_ID=MMETSP0206-20130828/25452_1 /ASSEMBLY_ACC=CAM_ASM_000279 /TAXON_ID=36767 /ORGANISM="Euplotes focardii, Strain TN1" /LENGTH=352 /DNA_ID=CAMNT_0053124615 /DNA_START=245 /DNA_END=1303 /DNA_ORIENTATION=+
MKVEDHYYNKFFRESYINWHIYAQNFHPSTLNERVRAVHFYRKPKTLFKGFSVPDWAQAQKRDGYDIDVQYSIKAWENAMNEFRSEWTPMPFAGERVDPNVINWFRIEQIGKGLSSRLFYNETPKPTWHRYGGNLDDPEKTLYSFKYGDQAHQNPLGFDTSTKEGRESLEAEVQRWKQMTPEVYEAYGFDKSDGNQLNKYISSEPHFQRALTHYRAYELQQRIEAAIEAGSLTQQEVNSARAFFDERGLPAANLLVLGQKGLLGEDGAYTAITTVLQAVGLDGFSHNITTSLPVEDQFIDFLDGRFDITEEGLTKALPLLISDERDRSRIESLIASGNASEALPQESTQQLA